MAQIKVNAPIHKNKTTTSGRINGFVSDSSLFKDINLFGKLYEESVPFTSKVKLSIAYNLIDVSSKKVSLALKYRNPYLQLLLTVLGKHGLLTGSKNKHLGQHKSEKSTVQHGRRIASFDSLLYYMV